MASPTPSTGARRRRSPLATALLAIATCAAALVGPVGARANPPNPSTNLQIGTLPSNCYREPSSQACADGVIYYLDQARATMGLGPYALPADFLSLTPGQQMFVLTNLDRIAYSEPPVEGLVTGLDAAAASGAQRDADPEPESSDLGAPLEGWASNWAGGYGSALEAYFFWMYSDGYGSGNLDCRSPGDPGCWGHRQDTLFTAGASGEADPLYSMGAAATTDGGGSPSYAMTITASEGSPRPTYHYTWAQAVADGAGTNVFSVTAPVEAKAPIEAKAKLRIVLRGSGVVSGPGGLTCHRTCTSEVTEHESVTLRATPAPGYRLVHWLGCETVNGPVCVVETDEEETLAAVFVPLRGHGHRHRTHGHRRHRHHGHLHRNRSASRSSADKLSWPRRGAPRSVPNDQRLPSGRGAKA